MQPAEIIETDIPKSPEVPKDAKLLQIKAKCVVDDDSLIRNLKESMKLKIPHFHPSPMHNREIVLVGAGPSVENFVEKIQHHKDRGHYIVAIKGAHDYLIKHGVIPHAAVGVDPQPKIVEAFQLNHKDVTYFLASQVNLEVFKFLSHRNVVLWHLLTGKPEEKGIVGEEPLIGGGSTSGTRSMVLAWSMGFRRMHLYGFDSCLTGKQLKLNDVMWERPEVLRLWINGREFFTNPAMGSQCTEFEKLLVAFKNQIQVKVYGDGAIPWICESRIMKGEIDVVPIDKPFRPQPCHKDWFNV